MTVALAIAIPLLLVVGLGFLVLALLRRGSDQASSPRDPKGLRAAAGYVLIVTVLGIGALGTAIAHATSGQWTGGGYVLLTVGILFGIGGIVVEVILWQSIARSYKGGR